MNYANLVDMDLDHGSGVRVSLYVSGCPHRCDGCYDQKIWDYTYGNPYTKDVEDRIMEMLKPEHIDGLAILGGEPLAPVNQSTVRDLLIRFHREFSKKSVWVFTGYRYEDIKAGNVGETAKDMLEHINVLVDGSYIKNLRTSHLIYRHSTNQRIIDVHKKHIEERMLEAYNSL